MADQESTIVIGRPRPVRDRAGWEAFDGLVLVRESMLDAVSPGVEALRAEMAAVVDEMKAEASPIKRAALGVRVAALLDRIDRRLKLKPVRLQNRDRSTAASIAQVRAIGANPDPDLLGYSKEPTSGAPIVFADYDELPFPRSQLGRHGTVTFAKDMSKIPVQYAVVEAFDVMVSHDANGDIMAGYDLLEAPGKLRAVAGNGRAAGIQLAYHNENAAGYVAGLIEDADLLQIDEAVISGLKQPMLVRIMDHADVTADIGDKTNSSGMAGFSAVEQAKNDAERVDFDALSFTDDGAPTLDALVKFVQAMPLSEQATLAPDGTPTTQALDRLMAATFNRAYANDDLVKLYSQSLDAEIKNVLFGMAQAAGDMAALAGKGDYDIRAFVTDAAGMAATAKRAGQPLSRLAEQRDITMPEATNDIAAMFARNARSAKRIAEALRSLARAALAEADDDAEDMFGPKEKRKPDELVQQAMAGGSRLLDAVTDLPPDGQGRVRELIGRLESATGMDRARIASEIISVAGTASMKTARAYFRAALQDSTVETAIGPVRIVGGTFKEMKRGMALDGLKAALIPHVPEILSRGAYHGREGLNKERSDGYVAFHFFSLADIKVGSTWVEAGVTVAERNVGEFEYRMTAYGLGHSGESRWQKRIGGTLVRGQEPRVVPPIEPAEPTLDAIMAESGDDGNIAILAIRESAETA